MAKKPSYIKNLTNSPKKRATYFYVKRGSAFLPALACGKWLSDYSSWLGWIGGVVIFFLIYIFIAHYIALAVCAIEDAMS